MKILRRSSNNTKIHRVEVDFHTLQRSEVEEAMLSPDLLRPWSPDEIVELQQAFREFLGKAAMDDHTNEELESWSNLVANVQIWQHLQIVAPEVIEEPATASSSYIKVLRNIRSQTQSAVIDRRPEDVDLEEIFELQRVTDTAKEIFPASARPELNTFLKSLWKLQSHQKEREASLALSGAAAQDMFDEPKLDIHDQALCDRTFLELTSLFFHYGGLQTDSAFQHFDERFRDVQKQAREELKMQERTPQSSQ